MRNKAFELTKGEEVLMELFWSADRPLTSMEQLGINDEKALAKVAFAMVQRFADKQKGGTEELVKQLENIVEQLKKS